MTKFQLFALSTVIAAGLCPAPVSAQEQVRVEPTSTAAEVLTMATGQNMDTALMRGESTYAGPMAGGTRGLDAAREVRRSQVPRMYEPGTLHYRPRFIAPHPLPSRRPTTFNNRHTSWRLGFVSDGFRGSYFR
jgi:hypothetical protein